jgi:uncharacterized Zn-finger protein
MAHDQKLEAVAGVARSGEGMSKFDHEQVCQWLGMYDVCEGDYDNEEECPHCGELFDWIVDENDEIVCPHCNALVWSGSPKHRDDTVDEEEVPL